MKKGTLPPARKCDRMRVNKSSLSALYIERVNKTNKNFFFEYNFVIFSFTPAPSYMHAQTSSHFLEATYESRMISCDISREVFSWVVVNISPL